MGILQERCRCKEEAALSRIMRWNVDAGDEEEEDAEGAGGCTLRAVDLRRTLGEEGVPTSL